MLLAITLWLMEVLPVYKHRMRRISVDISTPIVDVLVLLEEKEVKLIFVVKDNKLVGSVTDGDIRRAFIRGVSPTDAISNAMFEDTAFAYEDDSLASKHALFRRDEVDFIPILNKQREIIKIVSQAELSALPNRAVLLAGGLGSRLQPLTVETPKPMLKIGGKPLLETILLQLVSFGIYEFYISVNYKAKQIMDYFQDGSQWGVHIEYLQEDKKLGTAGALSLIDAEVKAPLILMNGDILTNASFDKILSFHQNNNNALTLCTTEYRVTVPYGVVCSDEHQCLTKVKEKPEECYNINAGIYVVEPRLLKLLEKKQSIDMPDFIDKLIFAKNKVGVWNIEDFWLDIGKIEDYHRAHQEYFYHFDQEN